MSGTGARLAGKSAIVTGAAQGIGRATAIRFAEEGAVVTCVDVQAERVGDTVGVIERSGGRANAVVADIATDAGNQQMVESAVEVGGGLDVLHANAAVQIMARLEDTSEEQWDRTHATNLRGVYLGIKRALPHLRRRGGGSIIITSSLLGYVGNPDLPAYGAMKGGLRSLCRSLATDLGADNIRVNTICPGDVDTALLQEYFDAQDDPVAARQEIVERYPMRRFATPRDVANAALFLASDEAGYITGTDIIVDGGLYARDWG
jgi:NAD(P)-dependent dehydrogenase (short-subunit alcohol dehydrogenase family)